MLLVHLDTSLRTAFLDMRYMFDFTRNWSLKIRAEFGLELYDAPEKVKWLHMNKCKFLYMDRWINADFIASFGAKFNTKPSLIFEDNTVIIEILSCVKL